MRPLPLALVAALLTAAPAQAQTSAPPPASQAFPHIVVRLAFTGTAGCPGERALRAEVASWVGYDPFGPTGADLVKLSLDRVGNLYRASFSLTDADGESGVSRELDPDCKALFRTLGISLGLAIAPSDTPAAAAPAPPPEPVAPAPAPTEPAPVAPPPPTIAPPPIAPAERSFRLVAGLDGIFLPFIAPSASAGFSLWAGIELSRLPLSIELDLRSTWTVAPAHLPLAYQSLFAVRASYVSGVLAGCWRGPVYVCPLFEVGRMSFAEAGPLGGVIGPQSVVAAGLRGIYVQRLGERFVVRGLAEVEGLLKPATVLDETRQPVSSPGPVSLTLGLGFGGFL